MRWTDVQSSGRALRPRLPQPNDRLPIGNGLTVSPICIGAVPHPEILEAAFANGINFFLVSLDLHWPLYEHTRAGIARLLRSGVRRDDFVVALVSYLDEPLFRHFQAREFINAVPGVERADVIVAGAIATDHGFMPRMTALQALRDRPRIGARAQAAPSTADATCRTRCGIASSTWHIFDTTRFGPRTSPRC